MLGAVCGLVGAIFLGPRLGKFDEDTPADEFRPHNVGMVCLGTLILWFGWYGFNGGSALGATGANSVAIQVVCMNTTLSAAAGGLTVFLLVMLLDKIECVSSLANGLLAGLVGITAGCDAANSWWALLIGVVSGILFVCSTKLLKALKIDDPLDAFSVHGACGFWGVVASGLVRVFVGGAESKVLTGCLIGALVIIGWTTLCSIVI
jgi:Amt family ammonium transporter